jgi:hypothetical protein
MGANNADFHNITFSHVETGKHQDAFVNATHPEDGIVGQLHLGFIRSNGNRKVRNVLTKVEHQRKGIATGMWSYAKANGLNPEHSPDSQTDEGKSWAKKVGD